MQISTFSRRVSLVLGALLLLGGASAAFAQSPGVPWTAIDDLGRKVAGPEASPDLRENKTVGIFYFLWLDPTTPIPVDPNAPKDAPRPYDLRPYDW
ncbi:MAG: hypothetical protein HUK22_02815, partial [Thermoguttaceae bacterium]|nr:hypothetical protein [Thermoguttaceae bacterium]